MQTAGWAIHRNGSYFQAKYKRRRQGRGHKRAILAVAHALLVTIYYLLNATDRIVIWARTRKPTSLVRQLQPMGFRVDLTPMT